MYGVYCKCLLRVSIVSVYCKCLLRVSIVSVYCKCLLRLSIVSVYCQCLLCFRSNMLKHHVFYTVPLGNDETAWVVLRFRSKMLLFECVLLCFCSHMCKKPYKYSQKSCFFAYRLAKPLYLPLQIFALPKTIHFFELLWKNPNEMKTVFAIGGRLAINLLHALCVFLCIPLFELN